MLLTENPLDVLLNIRLTRYLAGQFTLPPFSYCVADAGPCVVTAFTILIYDSLLTLADQVSLHKNSRETC